MSLTRLVAITGCDSGLGWTIAARSAREGLVTVAGMYKGTDTKAAKALKDLYAHPYPLDVTKTESIIGFRDYVISLLKEHPDYKLHAIVNNAGIMAIGDYEWQTPAMIEFTINVNLLGAMRVVSAFLPDLRKSTSDGLTKPRIINVASHCGLQPLPGFAPYSASKAALLAWTQALRMETRRHGLSAVAFVPGGFVGASHLLSNQEIHGSAMLENLDDEQKEKYENTIKALTLYLQSASQHASFDSLKDENIIETFMKALTDDNPKKIYKVESMRYKFYYNLLKLPLPEAMHHWLINRFVNFPKAE